MDDNQLGDEPIEPGHKDAMRELAHILDVAFNGTTIGSGRTTGFVLLVFPFGSRDGRCNYISNGAGRGDIATLFEEQAKRFREQGE